jgi:hypothetical protein
MLGYLLLYILNPLTDIFPMNIFGLKVSYFSTKNHELRIRHYLHMGHLMRFM